MAVIVINPGFVGTKCVESISEDKYLCVDLSDEERKIRVFKLKNSGNRLYQIVSEES